MQRRSFIKNTTLILGALALLNKKTVAAFLADPSYKIKMLSDNMGVFTEKGGTMLFYINKQGVVVVDAQFPDTAQHCIGEIKKLTTKKFEYLINTHHHGDHTDGNIAFKGITKHVVAHENSLINQEKAAVKNKKESQQLYPDLTYDKLWSRKLKGERITMYHFGRGHTNGDSFVHFEKANVVHVGDLVFNRKFPYIDKSSGAHIGEWIKSLNKATEKFDEKTTYVCGHAAEDYDILLTKNDVLLFRDYLSNLLKLGTESITKGMSKEDFMKITAIPNSPEWKGDGISRSLEAVWNELHEVVKK
jgi:cyclase